MNTSMMRIWGAVAALVSVVSTSSFAADEALIETGLKNESEFGLIVAKGNSDVETYSVKHLSEYRWTAGSLLKFFGNYLNAFNEGTESAKYWNLGVRYEYALTDRFSIYAGQSVEANRFQNIKQRYNSDLGGKYYLRKHDNFYWFAEAGYRYTRENQTFAKKNYQFLRAYTEAEKKWGTGTIGKATLEYLPNLSDSDDFLLNSELSISSMLNSVFALKTAYVVKFDNEPAQGSRRKTDHVVTSSLVARF